MDLSGSGKLIEGSSRYIKQSEVVKQFHVTRERIRQIEAKALRKLRHPTRSDYLRKRSVFSPFTRRMS